MRMRNENEETGERWSIEERRRSNKRDEEIDMLKRKESW